MPPKQLRLVRAPWSSASLPLVARPPCSGPQGPATPRPVAPRMPATRRANRRRQSAVLLQRRHVVRQLAVHGGGREIAAQGR